MEVHGHLGCGFLEPVYQEALEIELAERGIPSERQVEIDICYKGHTLSSKYRPDFICFGDVVVELKALAAITDNERAQVINYLKASGLARGLLINFGAQRLQFERFIFTHSKKPSASSASSADWASPSASSASSADGPSPSASSADRASPSASSADHIPPSASSAD